MASTLTSLIVHVIFSTKNRNPLIDEAIKPLLYGFIEDRVRMEHCEPMAIGGTNDHLHLLSRIRTTTMVSELVKSIKGASSCWINREGMTSYRFAWQRGYGAFSVSASKVKSVVRYIERQERHHAVRTFEEEYVTIVRRYGLSFDESFLFD